MKIFFSNYIQKTTSSRCGITSKNVPTTSKITVAKMHNIQGIERTDPKKGKFLHQIDNRKW